jgi:hypothetical protein
MVPKSKSLSEKSGVKLGHFVIVPKLGMVFTEGSKPGEAEKAEVRHVGSIGFHVRGRMQALLYGDEGKTWRRKGGL